MNEIIKTLTLITTLFTEHTLIAGYKYSHPAWDVLVDAARLAIKASVAYG